MAPCGKSACRSLFGAIGRPRFAKNTRMRRSAAADRMRRFPAAFATASRVRSSIVGPRPPERMRRSAARAARRTSSTRGWNRSGIVTWRVTSKPRSVRRRDSHAAFVLATRPRVSSSPLHRMIAVGGEARFDASGYSFRVDGGREPCSLSRCLLRLALRSTSPSYESMSLR